jgi:hypothetical protein
VNARTDADNRRAVRAVFRMLLDNPGQPDMMVIMAEALEECDADPWMITAYRWAVRLGRWPFLRVRLHGAHRLTVDEYKVLKARGKRRRDMVYDWDRAGRTPHPHVPESAQLPKVLFDWMCRPGGFGGPHRHVYRGVHSAFVLMARALKAHPECLALQSVEDVPVAVATAGK